MHTALTYACFLILLSLSRSPPLAGNWDPRKAQAMERTNSPSTSGSGSSIATFELLIDAPSFVAFFEFKFCVCKSSTKTTATFVETGFARRINLQQSRASQRLRSTSVGGPVVLAFACIHFDRRTSFKPLGSLPKSPRLNSAFNAQAPIFAPSATSSPVFHPAVTSSPVFSDLDGSPPLNAMISPFAPTMMPLDLGRGGGGGGGGSASKSAGEDEDDEGTLPEKWLSNFLLACDLEDKSSSAQSPQTRAHSY